LEKGKCVLLLDALDEVPGEHRNRLKDKLNRFAGNYPCEIICTSRIVGYGGVLVKGAKEVEIVPFSHKQTEEYIEIWFENAASFIDNSLSAKGLIQELRNKPQIGGLAQNPLLLSLLCSLYQEKGLTLPARRTQVYEKAVDCMLQKWSQNRKPQSEGKIRAKVRLLEELAYHFSCEGKEIFSSDELYDWIEEYLQSEKVPTVFRKTDTGELIAELSEEDGILQKLAREGDRYLFLHRTFQEYLTASYLNRTSNSIALAREHFWEYEWHETLSVLAGVMHNPVPLLQAITAQKDDIFSTLLLLAGRCVAECQENCHPLVAEIIDSIYKFWQSYPNAGFIESIVVAIGQVNAQTFQRLQKALNHPDSNVRYQAALALGQIGNPQAVEPLICALRDESIDVKRQAAQALVQMSNFQAVAALICVLSHSNRDVRWMAAQALGLIRNPQAVEALICALNDEDWDVRGEALEALGRIGNSQAVAALTCALSHSNRFLRMKTASVLGRTGNPQAVEALISALNHEDSLVTWKAALVLSEIGNAQAIAILTSGKICNLQAVEALIRALKDEDSYVRWQAIRALGETGSPQAVEPLIYVLKDADISVRWKAVEALGKIGNSHAVEPLISALNDEDSSIRSKAAEALGKIGNSQAVEPLISALNNEDYDVRREAVLALVKIGSSQAVEPLISALNHTDLMVGLLAARALGRIGNPQAVEALISALNHENSSVRWEAAEALGRVDHLQAMEALIGTLNHSDSGVRWRIASALAQIGNLETLVKLIQLPEIDIYHPPIFVLARTLAVRFSKERLPFIPVYPELVAHKQ
jgi:HEAT repeat protein